MAKHKILIVDDDPDILALLEYNLSSIAAELFTAQNGIAALQLAEAHTPNLILLDINMPKKDGFAVCEELRKKSQFKHTTIIFLTAVSDEASELRGLELGADDFLSKPIRLEVLRKKVTTALSKIENKPKGSLEFANIKIDREEYNVIFDGATIALARKEFELLYLLATDPKKIFDRNTILEQIWGGDVIVGDRTIDVHVRKIRAKLNDKFIYTVKGVGYKFVPE